MVTLNKTTNVNGISVVEVDGKQVQAAYMNASINVNGAFNSNHSIQNRDVFESHKKEVLEDFAAFDDYVYRLSNKADIKAELNAEDGGALDAETVLPD